MKPTAAIVLLTLTALSPCVDAAEMVFTNGLEVPGHHTSVVIAFPDVSRAPERDRQPSGIPIPYPNLGMASDTERGRSADRGILVNRSRFSQERNEEACDTPPTEGQRSGRAYFERYSFDVKIEPPVRKLSSRL